MKKTVYKKLMENEITLGLFSNFDRYQAVSKCWRKIEGAWVLKDIVFQEQWGTKNYESLVECLQRTVKTGGEVYGAFSENLLVGFASIENELFGSEKEYLQLSSLHVSNEYRGRGIGKELFFIMTKEAKVKGAKKLYMSTHSSEETQAFYKQVACIEAIEYNGELFEQEPYDCQLEYTLEIK